MFKSKQYNKEKKEKQLSNTRELPIETQKVFKKYLHQIQQLTGVTPGDFDLLYKKILFAYFGYFNQLKHPLIAATLDMQLQPVVWALKRRLAYLLPLGADSEVIFREQEIWTFAVFSAALGSSQDQVEDRMQFVQALIPPIALAWLQRNSTVFALWQAYLLGETQNNIFSMIIHPVTNQGEKPLNVATEIKPSLDQAKTQHIIEKPSESDGTHQVAINDSNASFMPYEIETTENIAENSPSQSLKFNKNAEIKVIDLATLKSQAAGLSEDQKALSNKLLQQDLQNTAVETRPHIELKADDFWNWLKQSLRDQSITVNEMDSLLHQVELGLLIRIPEAAAAFIQSAVKTHGLISDAEVISQLPTLTKQIKKHEALLRTKSNARIHAYYWGSWADRHTISGILIKTHELLGEATQIPINQNLAIDVFG